MPTQAVRSDSSPSGKELLDVLVVGAGLSGIGTAYWLQHRCPQLSYAILEARTALGGTWDLFRYPGVRSDSDMFTFGYRFRPWQDPKSLSDGASIRAYLRATAEAYGIDRKIRYEHRVKGADWSDAEQCWTLSVETREGFMQLHARFLYLCTGYYSYEEAHRPHFEGEADYRGTLVQPQFWPQQLDYSGKRVLIVGSGATAVTLVPTMAQSAAHVTMLQRSPTYVLSLPRRDTFYQRANRLLSARAAYRLTRWKNLLLSMLLYGLSRAFPRFVRRLLRKGAAKQLPEGYEVDRHFNPRYDPWDQRLCFVPGGDLYAAIRKGKADVVTDTIERFTKEGVCLQSGEELAADIIVLATGLKVRLLGGAELRVNGKPVITSESMIYRGMLVSDVPNLALAFGYTNASWTLKTDLTANYVCRLLNYMQRKGYRVVMPKREPAAETRPFLDFDAGYIQRATDVLPKQGRRRPWRVYQNYFLDMLATRFGRVADGVLQFKS